MRSCSYAVLLYVQSDVVLALSVDLPTVQMDWIVFCMNWALVSQFLLLSCFGQPFIDTEGLMNLMRVILGVVG